MFLDYKNVYKSSYKVLENELNNKNLSHAYLFEINDVKDYDFILDFIKQIFFISNVENLDIINHQIDNNIFDDFSIIETNTKTIKKEQILELKKSFKNTSYNFKNKVYLIKEAEKLNDSSANSLLKFLEDPMENIIGVLVTQNIYNVIPTLLSRCQIISLDKKYLEDSNQFFSNIGQVFKFIGELESNKFKVIAKEGNFFKEMEFKEIDMFLKTILFIYRDFLNILIGCKLKWFSNHRKEIEKLLGNNDLNDISRKINVIVNIIECNNTNMNKSMLFDKLVIEISGGK